MLNSGFQNDLPRRSARWALLAALVVAALVYGLALRPLRPGTNGDAEQYLSAGYHLRHHGVFNETPEIGPVVPGVGREPGYGVLLAVLMAVDPGLGAYTPHCLASSPSPAGPEPCGPRLYHSLQWANVGLALVAALLLYGVVRTAGGSRVAALAAALLILANNETMKSRHWVVSDYLAMALLTLLLLTVVRVWRRPERAERWALAGLALAALALTKAVYLIFGVLILAGLGLVAVFRLARGGAGRGRQALAILAFVVAFTGPVAGWMARNQGVSGDFALTRARAGVAHSTREVFNHLTPAQYLCAFVFWTRGFGDDLAQARFPRAVWEPFLIDQPGGLYDVGQNRIGPWMAAAMAQRGLSVAEAERDFEREMRQAILAHPLAHIAATLPVFYRGLWIDEFILLTLPALIWLTLAAARRWWFRRGGEATLVLILVAPGWFNLLFYALTSLNIPRYQMTALPVLALAGGLVLERVLAFAQARLSAR